MQRLITRRARPKVRVALFGLVFILCGCASEIRELMPTPSLFRLPAAHAIFAQVPEPRRRSEVDLLFVTDRAPERAPEAPRPYGEERSRSLGFGSAIVRLLPQMSWTELERHSLSEARTQPIHMAMGEIREIGRYPHEPYPLRVTPLGVERDPDVLAQHKMAEAQLQSEVRKRLRESPSGQVMLYVHGFNETFDTAAYTAAELCHFLGREHVCAFFTWPASTRGNPLFSYANTTESAQYSVGHLKKVIRTLAQTPDVKGLQLLAHSRGTALLLMALRELSIESIVAGEEPAESLKLENVVLMSPDIDAEVASQQVEIFASDPGLTNRWRAHRAPRFVRGRFTIYASPSDRALLLSKILFRSHERVGQLSPEKLSTTAQDYFAKVGYVDLIVYEGKRTDAFGHSYFTSNPEVSADLIELVRNGTLPGEPGRPLVRAGKIVWLFPSATGKMVASQ